LDISIVVDTSGSQAVDKAPVVEGFMAALLAEFDTQTAVKISITAVGDGRDGQVETVYGPVQFADTRYFNFC